MSPCALRSNAQSQSFLIMRKGVGGRAKKTGSGGNRTCCDANARLHGAFVATLLSPHPRPHLSPNPRNAPKVKQISRRTAADERDAQVEVLDSTEVHAEGASVRSCVFPKPPA